MNSIQEWKWERWDVRADGKVFWQYDKLSRNGQRWVTWDQAIKLRNSIRLGQSKYQKNNPHKKNEYMRGEKRAAYMRNYLKQRSLSDPVFAMACRLRVRTSVAILKKGYSKTSKTKEILGCSWEDLKYHLESKFNNGMSWKNRNLWHIDHIVPLASAKSKEELISLCHYTNLQPLWAEDNLKKGSTIQM
jgi:hypothetical protein